VWKIAPDALDLVGDVTQRTGDNHSARSPAPPAAPGLATFSSIW
jgi:hypothetical protein